MPWSLVWFWVINVASVRILDLRQFAICGLSLLVAALLPRDFSQVTPVYTASQKPVLPNQNLIWDVKPVHKHLMNNCPLWHLEKKKSEKQLNCKQQRLFVCGFWLSRICWSVLWLVITQLNKQSWNILVQCSRIFEFGSKNFWVFSGWRKTFTFLHVILGLVRFSKMVCV